MYVTNISFAPPAPAIRDFFWLYHTYSLLRGGFYNASSGPKPCGGNYSECVVVRHQLNIRLNFSASKRHYHVCHLIWTKTDLNSTSHTLLFCLAVADVLVGLISQPSFAAFKTAELLRQFSVYCNLSLIQFFSGWIIGGVSYRLILSGISIDKLLALSLHDTTVLSPFQELQSW